MLCLYRELMPDMIVFACLKEELGNFCNLYSVPHNIHPDHVDECGGRMKRNQTEKGEGQQN